MLQIIFVLIGTFIGAGFASGKEIFNFFTIYSYSGIISIVIFSFLLFLLIWKCLYLKIKLNINQYSDLIYYFGQKCSFFNQKIFGLIMNIFLSSCFYTMIIALSSLFQYQLHIEKIITITVTLFICYFIFFRKKIQFIYTINSILIPVLIIFLFFLFFRHIHCEQISFPSISVFNSGKGIIMGLFYFSYNSLLMIPILFNLNFSKQEKNIFKISFIFSNIIFLMTFFLNYLLLSHYSNITTTDLPVLHIVNTDNSIFIFLYFFVILSAIFTTMISSGFSFINNFNKNNFHLKLLIFLILSLLFSSFSFSSLINFFYPLFGVLGFFQLILLFL